MGGQKTAVQIVYSSLRSVKDRTASSIQAVSTWQEDCVRISGTSLTRLRDPNTSHRKLTPYIDHQCKSPMLDSGGNDLKW